MKLHLMCMQLQQQFAQFNNMKSDTSKHIEMLDFMPFLNVHRKKHMFCPSDYDTHSVNSKTSKTNFSSLIPLVSFGLILQEK